MNRSIRNLKLCAALAAIAAAPLAAYGASGEFTFVTGEVSLVKANGQRVTPARGTPVDPGDRIVTGANGMVQLTMVDNARLSLRPSTQFVIEQYAQARDSAEGGILNLVKGTLRAFTGLISATNRDKFVMKTRVATVGIRGSGNILYACEGRECDESVASGVEGPVTVNHTIEGAHAITNILAGGAGLPAQQGGPETLVTGPGQTVLVVGAQPPRYIPTPAFIASTATNPTGAKVDSAAPGAGAGETRNFSPSDAPVLPAAQIANVGPGFTPIDATGNLANDQLNLRDVVIATGSPLLGQALARDVTFDGSELRSYRSYPGTGSNAQPAIEGGSGVETQGVSLGGVPVAMGRHQNASISFFGPGTSVPVPGSIHWIVGPSGYPAYLASVLTGTATYTLAAATSPTNQHNTAGTFGSASLDANFGNRTLDFRATVSIPTQGQVSGGTWNMEADDVPITRNTFFGSTNDRLVVRNGAGQSSANNANISGSIEGSFVGTGLPGVILGYGIRDTSSGVEGHEQFVTGVAAFTGTAQNGAAPFREGRVSDTAGALTDFIQSYATTTRPDEVTADAQGRVTAFSAPFAATGSYSRYELGSAQVVESGFDAETGMVWGRWGNGAAVVGRGAASQSLQLTSSSLHYIFAGPQSGPVALPLSGVATYDVIGSTSPTDRSGHVGTLGSASLAANFSSRTVDAAVTIGINGQTWTGSANGMPIYRDQYFSAYSGTPIPGLPNPAPLAIGCTPNCGAGATGSFDGFFTGRTGQRAGMIYNLGGNSGAIAFGRRGGGG